MSSRVQVQVNSRSQEGFSTCKKALKHKKKTFRQLEIRFSHLLDTKKALLYWWVEASTFQLSWATSKFYNVPERFSTLKRWIRREFFLFQSVGEWKVERKSQNKSSVGRFGSILQVFWVGVGPASSQSETVFSYFKTLSKVSWVGFKHLESVLSEKISWLKCFIKLKNLFKILEISASFQKVEDIRVFSKSCGYL